MKNILFIALSAGILISSCKKGYDLYNDPDAPADIPPSLALTSLEVNSFMNTEGDFARVSSVLTQQMAGAADYSALLNYQFSANDYNNHWDGLYANTMYNAKLMIDRYSDINPYYAGAAKVLMAINLSVTTDFFGDVPYSEAFKGNEKLFTAKLDNQQQLYDTIQSLLDRAIADFAKPESANIVVPGDDDVIFGGDLIRWTSAAWTLKARFANRLSIKDATGSATKVLTYLANGIQDAADNMENVHSDVSPNQWGDFQNQREGSIFANKKFIDILVNTDDPRLTYYFAPNKNSEYIGADINAEQINADVATTGQEGSYFDPARNYGLVTFHEAKFLEAEAKFRLGQDATTPLNEAIEASVKYVTGENNPAGTIPVYTPATTDLTSIMTEKWKAMFGHIEAYNDWRRTGIPVLTPRPQSVGAALSYIPKRLPTPTRETDGNPNAKIVPLDQPVWWDE